MMLNMPKCGTFEVRIKAQDSVFALCRWEGDNLWQLQEEGWKEISCLVLPADGNQFYFKPV